GGMSVSRAEEIRELIALLDGDDSTEAEEAQATLESYGADVLAPLMEAVPGFGRFGRLCAIELFEEIGDPTAAAALIAMLRDEDDTVREWSARALAQLRARDAVPSLRRAYAEVLRRGTPLDWTEPEAIRDALTALGAREEVVPPRVAELARDDVGGRCWGAADLPLVISELADAGQVVLYFQLWRLRRDGDYWKAAGTWELDWSLRWPELVESARGAALEAAREAGAPRKTVATVSWMAESDREAPTGIEPV
ncbi:MAG: HEAT repeat domain-containing protein, partial [Actinomycetota bacterium]|nr:HEAT repeat domain-containing protein [Actinomycetota bacterium]